MLCRELIEVLKVVIGV
jgi:hypothetical protein